VLCSVHTLRDVIEPTCVVPGRGQRCSRLWLVYARCQRCRCCRAPCFRRTGALCRRFTCIVWCALWAILLPQPWASRLGAKVRPRPCTWRWSRGPRPPRPAPTRLVVTAAVVQRERLALRAAWPPRSVCPSAGVCASRSPVLTPVILCCVGLCRCGAVDRPVTTLRLRCSAPTDSCSSADQARAFSGRTQCRRCKPARRSCCDARRTRRCCCPQSSPS
jgi:hypothetical protein